MGFLEKLFGGGKKAWKDETSEALFIYSQCEACQEKFRNRIDKVCDLLATYSDDGPAYRVHKELIGSRCRKTVIVELEFDAQKHLTATAIQGGQFITREEFEGEEEGSGEMS